MKADMADIVTLRIDTACKVAEEFIKLYFDAIDQKRHTLSRFYMDNATLVWDGHVHNGKDPIQKFLEGIPVTTHFIQALDGQPVSIEAVKGQQTVVIFGTGNMKFPKESGSTLLGFAYNFVVTAQDQKWKIFSHTCRLQRPLPQS